MPDDELEIERERAKARAKAGRSRSQDWTASVGHQPPTYEGQSQKFLNAPKELWQQGVQQAKRGNWYAGGLNLANAAAAGAFSPISIANEAMRAQVPVVGKPMANVADFLFSLPSKAVDYGTNKLSDYLRSTGIPERTLNLGMSPKNAQEASEAQQRMLGNVSTVALLPEVVKRGGSTLRGTGGAMESVASKLAGKAFGAGENFMRTRELGKFAQEHGIALSEKGYNKSSNLATALNDEIQNKIIQPATQAGVLIDGQGYVQALEGFKDKLNNRAVPDRASLVAVDRMINAAKERLTRTDNPGKLTPDEAQQMKVENNQILSEVYKRLAEGGNITERGVAKKAALMKLTDKLRFQLEDIHPELKNVNWHEGQALQLKNAIYDHLNRMARGEGSTNVVARGGMGKAMTLSIYDMLHLKPISSHVAVLLGKAGRTMSGNKPNIVTGVENPFQAPPQVGGMPVSGNPTGTPPDVQDARFSEIPPKQLPPSQPKQLTGGTPPVEPPAETPPSLPETTKPPSEPQEDFMAKARQEINKPNNFTPEQQAHADEVKKYGVEYQQDLQDANGKFIGREYRIIDPNSKANNSNISVKSEEDLQTRIQQKKIESGDISTPPTTESGIDIQPDYNKEDIVTAFKLPSGEIVKGVKNENHAMTAENNPKILDKNENLREGIISGFNLGDAFITSEELHDANGDINKAVELAKKNAVQKSEPSAVKETKDMPLSSQGQSKVISELPKTSPSTTENVEVGSKTGNLRVGVSTSKGFKTGTEGETHTDIDPSSTESQRRFVLPNNKVVTRPVAKEWVKDNQPKVYKAWESLGKKEFHSEDYWKAVEQAKEAPIETKKTLKRKSNG